MYFCARICIGAYAYAITRACVCALGPMERVLGKAARTFNRCLLQSKLSVCMVRLRLSKTSESLRDAASSMRDNLPMFVCRCE